MQKCIAHVFRPHFFDTFGKKCKSNKVTNAFIAFTNAIIVYYTLHAYKLQIKRNEKVLLIYRLK